MLETVTLYTDGSCMPNPGVGGFGFIFIEPKTSKEWCVNGGELNTTNNRMEMTAVIEGLKFLKNYSKFKIYSDSMYVINCASGKWKRTKNVDLWEQYAIVSKNKNIEWIWVKAHNGDKYNEMVDKLAKQWCEKNQK
jgi:ribonuclease HI